MSRGLVIHGGVGTLPPPAMTTVLEAAYRDALTQSLLAGHEVLEGGGAAVDAVTAAVRIMEDSPLFNAGRGSNFDERGVITMDASIMDGATLQAGAVAGVTDVRNPIDLARLVMGRSEHVMLIGEGAERFARLHGIEETAPSFFHTDRRWDALQRAKVRGGARPNVLGDEPSETPGTDATPEGPEADAEAGPGAADAADGRRNVGDPSDRTGTVGAVALDRSGRLAAGTSTGGMANKSWGRVGDSPIIGAGTYASKLCAVSCTGWGEHFIRNAAAYEVHARMAHAGAPLSEAVRAVVFDTLQAQVPGSGGMIALDSEGNAELSFNTPGMYRGWIGADGAPRVGVYGEEGVG